MSNNVISSLSIVKRDYFGSRQVHSMIIGTQSWLWTTDVVVVVLMVVGGGGGGDGGWWWSSLVMLWLLNCSWHNFP